MERLRAWRSTVHGRWREPAQLINDRNGGSARVVYSAGILAFWVRACQESGSDDGRDPNSFANVAWIFGLHDRRKLTAPRDTGAAGALLENRRLCGAGFMR